MSDTTLTTASPPAPKARKKRYSFRDGDDVLILQTLLSESRLWSHARAQRKDAWVAITAELNEMGISATTHSIRCRLKRIMENFQAENGQGTREGELRELEQLLAIYAQKEVTGEGEIRGQVDQGPNYETRSQHSVGSGRSLDIGSDEEPTQSKTTRPEVRLQSTPESGKKPRKKRFVFQDWHDVLLLNAVLDDQEIVKASGAKKHDWKSITADLNSQGLDVKAHTIRTHLRLLVDMYRRESIHWDESSDDLSEKQELLREYCRIIHEEDKRKRANNDDRSFEPTPPPEIERFSLSSDIPSVSKRPERTQVSLEEERSLQRVQDALPTSASQDRDIAPITGLATHIEASLNTQGEAATQSPPVAQSPLTTQDSARAHQTTTEGLPSTPVLTAAPIQTLPATPELLPAPTQLEIHSHSPSQTLIASQTSAMAEDESPAERASKRQKLDLESLLKRFLSGQSERQKEEQAARISALQEQQRQTYELHKKTLEMQQKTANMQERILRLMERVMDKLD